MDRLGIYAIIGATVMAFIVGWYRNTDNIWLIEFLGDWLNTRLGVDMGAVEIIVQKEVNVKLPQVVETELEKVLQEMVDEKIEKEIKVSMWKMYCCAGVGLLVGVIVFGK